MNLENSYRILEIDSDSSEKDRHKAYRALREKLNRKLANAPTSGLKEKYSRALQQLDEAIECVESSIDANELPLFSELPLDSQNSAAKAMGVDPEKQKASGNEISFRSSGKMVAVLIGVGILLVLSFLWWQQAEEEGMKIASAKIIEAERAKKAARFSARLELESLKQPFVEFSRKRKSIIEEAESRNAELKTAQQVVEREGTEEEKEISTYRMNQYALFVDWLRDYLEKYSFDDELESVEALMVEGRWDEARKVFSKPVPEILELEKKVEIERQKKYDLPVMKFLARREFDLALTFSRKAVARLDFETAIEWIKPYENAEYINGEAESELNSLYKRKAEDAFQRARHAADIGEFKMAQRILDTLENDPIVEERSSAELDLIELLNSEYAFEESVMASKTALEQNDYEQAREQWTYLVDDPYVGDRARNELIRVDGLSEAWKKAQEARAILAEQALMERVSKDQDVKRTEVVAFDEPPRMKSKTDPVFPDALRRKNVNGFVELEWSIGLDGRTEGISVLSSSHHEFELPAIEAVKRWRFQPAKKEGIPVSVKVRQKVLFNPK